MRPEINLQRGDNHNSNFNPILFKKRKGIVVLHNLVCLQMSECESVKKSICKREDNHNTNFNLFYFDL